MICITTFFFSCLNWRWSLLKWMRIFHTMITIITLMRFNQLKWKKEYYLWHCDPYRHWIFSEEVDQWKSGSPGWANFWRWFGSRLSFENISIEFVLFSREKLGQTCNNLCRTNTNDVLLMLFNTKKRRSFLLIETILNKLRDPLAKDDWDALATWPVRANLPKKRTQSSEYSLVMNYLSDELCSNKWKYVNQSSL